MVFNWNFSKTNTRGVQPPESSLHKHDKAKGISTGERACSSRTSCIEGEILNLNHVLMLYDMSLIRHNRRRNVPSNRQHFKDELELHALSPRYALGKAGRSGVL